MPTYFIHLIYLIKKENIIACKVCYAQSIDMNNFFKEKHKFKL